MFMKKRILPMLMIAILFVAALSGCAKNYSVDEPFDFNSLTTSTPDVLATPAPVTDGIGNPFLEEAEKYIVPEDVTKDMTAEALFETYMSYPMLTTICFEENPTEAYKKWLADTDHCVDELLNRDDAVEIILNKYISLVGQQTKEHLSEDKDIETEGKIDWIEFLLMEDQVKDLATDAQKSEIAKYAKTRDDNNILNGYAIADLYPDLASMYQ